jgi:hypothetical protein
MLVVSPLGVTTSTVVPALAMHPATVVAPPDIFSAAKMPAASSAALGAEVPPKRN